MGQGGHAPPWNFQDHVFSPNFGPRKPKNHAVSCFLLCLAPPGLESLRKRWYMMLNVAEITSLQWVSGTFLRKVKIEIGIYAVLDEKDVMKKTSGVSIPV